MALMSQRAYARHRNCALRAVQKALESGRIEYAKTTGTKKVIDSDAADVAWQANTDPGKQSVDKNFLSVSAAGAVGGDDDAPPAVDDPAEFKALRTDRERLKRDREQWQFDRDKALTLDVRLAAERAYTIFRELRDRLENLGVRNSALLAAMTDPTECGELVDREIANVLNTFDIARVTKDDDDTDDDTDGAG